MVHPGGSVGGEIKYNMELCDTGFRDMLENISCSLFLLSDL